MTEHTSRLPETAQVLIAGCGPVGATLAALLGRFDIDVVVIDKAAEILMMPRAIALDNEALRVLQMVGVGETEFAQVAIPEVRMHSPVMGQFATANTRGSLDGHPKLVTFYQPELEQALEKRLQTLPRVKVVRQCELQSFTEDENGITAMIAEQDGSLRSLRCHYLIGADGASSLVRSLIGQDFQGKTYGEDWLIVDARQRADKAIDHVEFICDPKRAVPHMPAPGGRERWEFMLHAGERREDMEDAGKVAELMKPWSGDEALTVERTAVYRFHARCCDHFSRGRVHLVGDAAHITPPFVGQGLVAGLRDVANLGWKLAWVLNGQASAKILSSYDQERRPHAVKMINLARFMGHLIMTRNSLSAFLVHGVMRAARLIKPLRRHLEELEIKPANRFSAGLFKQGNGRCRLAAGSQFPQFWLRHNGDFRRSDDVLNQGLVMIGFACDPALALTAEQQRQWQQAGGRFLNIAAQGSAAVQSELAEDMTNGFLGNLPAGWLAVVRPDNFVMAEGPSRSAGSLLRQSLTLLGK